MRHQTMGARDWFDRIRRANPTLFAHWTLCHGKRPKHREPCDSRGSCTVSGSARKVKFLRATRQGRSDSFRKHASRSKGPLSDQVADAPETRAAQCPQLGRFLAIRWRSPRTGRKSARLARCGPHSRHSALSAGNRSSCPHSRRLRRRPGFAQLGGSGSSVVEKYDHEKPRSSCDPKDAFESHIFPRVWGVPAPSTPREGGNYGSSATVSSPAATKRAVGRIAEALSGILMNSASTLPQWRTTSWDWNHPPKTLGISNSLVGSSCS